MNSILVNSISDFQNRVGENPQILTTDMHDAAVTLLNVLKNYPESCEECEKMIEGIADNSSIEMRIYLYSMAMHIRFNEMYYYKLINICNAASWDIYNKQFLFLQLKKMRFDHHELHLIDGDIKLWKLHETISNLFKIEMGDCICNISINNRNSNLVIVLATQFLSFEHGPTKTAADRCRILIEKYHKKVLLINTAEVLNQIGNIPIYGQAIGNHSKEMETLEFIEWNGCRIPYFQCENVMPNMEIYKYLLCVISKLSPEYVISIGDGFFAQMVNEFVPVLTIGLCPSSLEFTQTKYQTFSKHIGEYEENVLHAIGRDRSHIIESTFSSSIVEKMGELSRGDIGLEDLQYVVAIVGGRLNHEMDADFMKMLRKLCDLDTNIHIMILGGFGGTGRIEDLPLFDELKGRIHYYGMVQDILSYLSLCNLYINPKRIGGGTSCVEAMSVGIPVLTLDFGDVSVNAGADFVVQDYQEMLEEALRYMKDEKYYKEKSEKAKNRADYLLDSDARFMETIDEFLKRIHPAN